MSLSEVSANSDERRGARWARKRLVVPALLVAVVGSLSTGWALASAFESPAQREASARPPAPAPVTSEVVKGTLEETISTKATVSRDVTESVVVPAPAATAVVTKNTLAPGAEAKAGSVLLEINGRPLFAIPGSFPFYRDLESGMTGPDVMQLQLALKQAGYNVTADGSLGGGTIGALQKMYAGAGYSPLTAAAATPQQTSSTQDAGAPEAATTAPVAALPVFPRSELLVLTATPAYVVDVPALGANVVATTSLTVEHGDVVATSDLDNAVAARLKAGMSVTLDAGQGGRIQAVVQTLVPTTATPQTSPDTQGAPASRGTSESSSGSSGQTRVQISATGQTPIPTALLRQQVLATISVHLAAADALIVPTIAVVPAGNGDPHVFKRQPDGSFRSIEVREIATLNGKSAVAPTQSGQLVIGDLVKVG